MYTHKHTFKHTQTRKSRWNEKSRVEVSGGEMSSGTKSQVTKSRETKSRRTVLIPVPSSLHAVSNSSIVGLSSNKGMTLS